jgi:hypothetical protein
MPIQKVDPRNEARPKRFHEPRAKTILERSEGPSCHRHSAVNPDFHLFDRKISAESGYSLAGNRLEIGPKETPGSINKGQWEPTNSGQNDEPQAESRSWGDNISSYPSAIGTVDHEAP